MGYSSGNLGELKDTGKVVIEIQHQGPLCAVYLKACSSFGSIVALSSEDFTFESPLRPGLL